MRTVNSHNSLFPLPIVKLFSMTGVYCPPSNDTNRAQGSFILPLHCSDEKRLPINTFHSFHVVRPLTATPPSEKAFARRRGCLGNETTLYYNYH